MTISAEKYVNDGQTWEECWRKVDEGQVGLPGASCPAHPTVHVLAAPGVR